MKVEYHPPGCFSEKRFNPESKVCINSCRFASECSGGRVDELITDPIKKLERKRNRGEITQAEFFKQSMEIVRRRAKGKPVQEKPVLGGNIMPKMPKVPANIRERLNYLNN